MPKLASTRPAYKMLTCIYLCRTLLFFAPYTNFYVKNQITDNRPNKGDDSIANEQLSFVYQNNNGVFHVTSPAKFLDLHAPLQFAKQITPPALIGNEEVTEWAFENITLPLFTSTQEIVESDAAKRKEYLQTAFSQIIMDLDIEINELQGKVLLGDIKIQEKLLHKMERKAELLRKKDERIREMEQMVQINPKAPEILGCAYVVPLSQMEYEQHYGMKRDDEVEAIAINMAIEYEAANEWQAEDVSSQNLGYDIRSINKLDIKRYIEVKGRSGIDGVMLSENEMNRLAQLGNSAWLYIVVNCKSKPQLHRIQNPAKKLIFERKDKGVQYYLPLDEWRNKTEK